MKAPGEQAADTATDYLAHLEVTTPIGILACALGWNARDWAAATDEPDPEVHRAAIEVLRARAAHR
jgi:hypothetical protein